ncbi:unnamed protein product [Paramecium sonneborni]|uniref:Uncharacterized protein n=1 Tax=Paramecium sonneborni TaxID=65129 RepID=A0A8S1L8P3_9CILI|nr:unnamed protein product [Paramecium sonneborni]
MAKEVQVIKLNSPTNIKKQNTQFCLNSIGVFDSNQDDEIKKSHQNLMKKYYEHRQAALSTNQSQKILVSKCENLIDKMNFKINTNKTKEKENSALRQSQNSDISVSNHLNGREKSCFKILQNSKDCNKQDIPQTKVLSINNTQMDKHTSDSNILMPLSSLVRKSQRQKNQPQLLQIGSNALILKDQIAGQDYLKQKSQSQQELHRCLQEEIEDTLMKEQVINKEIKQSSQFNVKQCFFSLAQGYEGSQINKIKSSSIRKDMDLQRPQVSKSMRAHTQGKQEQKQINRLYEYILEGNY